VPGNRFREKADLMPIERSSRRGTHLLYVVLFLFACFYTVHSTLSNDSAYVNLHVWAHGGAMLPYQKRALLVPLLRAAEHNRYLVHAAATNIGIGVFADPLTYPLFAIDLLSLIGCGFFVTRLYRHASSGRLYWMPSALMLVFFIVSVGFRWEHNYIFPYDFLSMFFFTAGVYWIYSGIMWPLILLMPIATYNRETTIMWVPLLLLAAWHWHRQGRTRRVRTLCVTAAALLVIWVTVTHWMALQYPNNDASEAYPRLMENIHHLLGIKGWIQMLSAFAFTMPFILLRHRNISDRLLRTFLWIVPLWFAIMFYQGEIIESRVFTELLPYVAVIATLELERELEPGPRPGLSADHPSN
jgi:hypothetical protein